MTCHIGSQWLVIYHNFFGFLLGVSRILDQTRPLLIVLEHGSPYSLASAEDSCQPSAVSHLRTTSLLDWCCKSQGYFLKSSCFERQTPLEVDFRASWVPSGGILRHQSILAWASGSLFLFGFQRNLFFYCKVNQKSINPGLGLWIAIFLDSSGKVNQKSINSGLGLWIFLFVWIRRKSQSETNQSRPGPLDLQRPAEESGRTCNFAALSFVSLSQMHPFRREFKTFGLQLQTWNLNLLNGNH